MNRLFILVLIILCLSCEKKTNEFLLYNQLINYNRELKQSVKSEYEYLNQKVGNNTFFRKKFDSLNEVNVSLQKSFEELQYEERKPILDLRDSFNKKYRLNLRFDSPQLYKKIPDSIFDKLTETEILRLRKKFQEQYLYNVVEGCK